jgi:DNA-binding IclR family transcriptional regulator
MAIMQVMALPLVKSAHRVVQIFEFFADRQAPAGLMEVARALGSPASSTSALLSTLERLGYLEYDRHLRTYMPTLRAALLGIWVNDLLLSDGTVLRLMVELREKTGETVVLGAQSGLQVQYIQVMHSLIRRSSPEVATGRLRPLLRSAVGQLILSLKDDREITALARRINAEEKNPANRMRIDDLLRKVDACRRDGYGYTEGATTPGAGIVAVLLPTPPHQPPIALGIGTVLKKLREQKLNYLVALRDGVKAHGRQIGISSPTRAGGSRRSATR